MPEDTDGPQPEHDAADGGSPDPGAAPPLRPVALRRADRWVLGEARRPEPGEPFEVLLADGTRQTFARPPITMTWVQPGSLLHEAAQDPAGVQRRFDTEPGQVVAQLLRDLGRPQVKGDLVQRVADLHLRAPGDWWPAVSRQLKAHPNVRVEGGKYSWSDSPVRAAAAAPPRSAARPATAPRTSPVRPAPAARPAPTAPASPVRPAPAPAATEGGGGTALPVAETSRQTQARLTVLRTLRQLAQGTGDDERLLRELESAAAELPAGSAESGLADVLVTAVLDPAAFDAAALPSRGLESSTRYDVARLAVRLRAHHAAVQALLALERLDTERLLAQVPWQEPGFAAALGAHLAGVPAVDGRTSQRVEGVLRQIALVLADAPDSAGVRTSALVLLTAVAGSTGAAQPGVRLLGRAALRGCLQPGLEPAAVRDLPAPGLLALWTGPLLPEDLPAAAAAALVLALDAADRGDVLGEPAFWAPLDLVVVAGQPGVADVLVRRDLAGPLLAPLAQAVVDGGTPRDVVPLLALPDDLLGALPPAVLDRLLVRAAERGEALRVAAAAG